MDIAYCGSMDFNIDSVFNIIKKRKIMKKVDWQEVKEAMVKHNGNAKFGIVFDSVCKTIADGLNGEFGKKEEKPPADKPK